MSQLADIIGQINQLTGFNVPTSSNIIISQSVAPVGSGSVNQIINYINGLTGYNIPSTNVQFVSGSNVAGPVVVYITPSPGGTIPTEGIQPGSIIKAEHILRIIYALSGVSVDDIIISGSFSTSGSNILDGTLSLPFISDGQFLYTSGGYVIGAPLPSSASFATSASYADTASFVAGYLLISETGSMLQPYVQTSQTSSMSVLSSSFALTASYALNSSTTTIKAGSGSIADFSGQPLSASILFNTSFSDTAYTVTITGEDLRAWSVQSKTTTGFTLNTNSSVALTGPVYWAATPFN